jgi:hypothetical protein
MDAILNYLLLLATGILVGKVVLLSFVVAPILAKNLERESFGQVVRQLFPAYYALGMAAAALGLLSLCGIGLSRGWTPAVLVTGGIWTFILSAESYCRTPLTPKINALRDQLKEQEARGAVDPALQAAWHRLHQRSVYLNSLVLLAGLSLIALVRSLL